MKLNFCRRNSHHCQGTSNVYSGLNQISSVGNNENLFLQIQKKKDKSKVSLLVLKIWVGFFGIYYFFF